MATYTVHYRYDDLDRTPGACQADEPMEPGEVFYAGMGRAIVRACRLNQSTDDTWRANARALTILASGGAK